MTNYRSHYLYSYSLDFFQPFRLPHIFLSFIFFPLLFFVLSSTISLPLSFLPSSLLSLSFFLQSFISIQFMLACSSFQNPAPVISDSRYLIMCIIQWRHGVICYVDWDVTSLGGCLVELVPLRTPDFTWFIILIAPSPGVFHFSDDEN